MLYNDKDKQALNNLKYYVKNYKIFIDTCSILDEGVNKFWINIIPLLQEYQNRIIIPHRVFEELNKHATNTTKVKLAKDAVKSLRFLEQLNKNKLIEIRGEKTDNFVDNVFQVVFTKFRMKYKLLLITQDKNLTKDILSLNSGKAVRANTVHVRKINRYGFLSVYKFENSESSSQRL